MEKYTIANAMASGKSDPTYGTEYIVKFAENEGTFKLWYKTQPKEGQEQWGTIDGWKFKKAKREDAPGGASSTSAPARPAYTKPAYKDNSDGMRQGMCINNAANYINKEEGLSAGKWAEAVHVYANALYLLGDLGDKKEAKEEPVDPSAEVKKVFGV